MKWRSQLRRKGAPGIRNTALLMATGILLGNVATSRANPFDPLDWERPVDQPVFTTEHGNNHDTILFVEPDTEFPYKMIVSHETSGADYWRAKRFSWNSDDWELVSDSYQIAGEYEYDDGIKVDGTYYIFENGNVYTFDGSLEEADGQWKKAGSFPNGQCADIGVHYEDGMFHIFGEAGNFPHGYDGTHLSHFKSASGLGDWEKVAEKAANPNPDGGDTYGVGDPTLAKIEGTYYLFSDRESQEIPYKIIAWKAESLDEPFEFLGKAITPRRDATDDWDNHRIQDGDIAYVPELSRYVMVCNMKDTDGDPGGDFPHLGENTSRVVGFFYSEKVLAPSSP